MNPTLEALSSFPGWTALDRQLANLLSREQTQGEPSWILWLSVALLSMATRQGDVCLELSELAGRPLQQVLHSIIRDQPTEAPLDGSMPELSDWIRELARSGLLLNDTSGTGGSPAIAPLVLKRNRLYLHRYFQHELVLAREIAARLAPVRALPSLTRVHAILERWMVGTAAQVKLAAAIAVLRRICIVIGGPGTGKTSTVVRLMGLLTELARESGQPDLRVLLLAPTGKAAARLSEAIAHSKQSLTQLPATIAALSTDTSTVHRAVGSCRRLRDGRRMPLIADLLVLDEASMVDLSMMRQLMEVASEVERVIILGDAHQLASVEAGAVLAELCAAGVAEFPPPLAAAIAELTGTAPSSSERRIESSTAAPIAAHVVELTESHRFSSGGGIGLLAKSINAGDVLGTLDLLTSGELSVAFVPASRSTLQRAEDRVVEANLRLGGTNDPSGALKQLERFRVLCAHRKGPYGLETWNERVARRVRGTQLARYGIGIEPILVTQNSPDGRLRNGDLGILWRDQAGARAYFASIEGETHVFGLSRIAAYESAFVMSIHKSQGSEADEILIILPEADSPLLTRELLYTAVTRARKRCTIVGTREAIMSAVSRRVERKSGLASAIAEATLVDPRTPQGLQTPPTLMVAQQGETWLLDR